ncbi:septum formation initiator family protein [Streptomyces sp. NPDC005963]|uniref:FtsB family cell division protein n=1 Tax=Streptomyces sp. NPDC005963 TaxID=3156721 RepID=UPI0033DD084A
MPAGPSSAARTPFVLLVVVLLGGGLIGLLLLNSALNEGSFELSELKRKTTELTDEQQALQRDVDDFSAPDALERRARELGMVPGGNPAFIDPDGTVRGESDRATSSPSPEATKSAAATPSAAPGSSAAPAPSTSSSPGALEPQEPLEPQGSTSGVATAAVPAPTPVGRTDTPTGPTDRPMPAPDAASIPAAPAAPSALAASPRAITPPVKPTPTPPGR